MIRLCALSFALGVVLLQGMAELPGGTGALVVGAGLILTLAGGSRIRGGGRWLVFVAWAAALALGFGWAGWRAELRLAEALPAAWEGRDIDLVGTVDELPRRYGEGSRVVLTVGDTFTEGAALPRRLLLSWYPPRRSADTAFEGDPLAEFDPRPGERWRLTVRLKRPHGLANPGSFDYEAWLLAHDLRATGYIRLTPFPERLPDAGLSGRQWIEQRRHQLRERLLQTTGDLPHGGVLIGLAIGDQGSIRAEDWRLFATTGVSHLMSVSGLHVTMLAGLAAALVGGLWRRVPALLLHVPAQRAAILAGALAALGYVALSGFGIPAQRTLLMLGIAALALWRGHEVSASRVLAAALVAVLVVDPWAVLAPGFWLSFVAVGALMMTAHSLTADQPATGWRRIPRALQGFGVTQWAATLATMPLLLLFFQSFSVVSPLANLIAIPLVSLLVTPLAVTAALTGIDILLLPAHLLTDVLIGLLQGLATWPGALRGQASPPLWALLLAAIGIAWLLLPAVLGARLAATCLLLPALFPHVDRPANGAAWADVMDVGHGLAVLVRTQQHTVLFDTGPPYGRGDEASDAGERVIVPALRALGVDRIDRLILSHGDSDHTGGAESVLAAIPVTTVSGHLPSDQALARRATPCTTGETWVWDAVRFTFLNRSPRGRGDNHDSCILRIESAAGRRLLLTADLEARDEAALLAAATDLRADVLQVPHQGSKGASSDAFLDAVAPHEAVAAVGYRNRFGHPHPATLARYAARDIRLWRTDRDGRVQVTLAEAVQVTGWRALQPRYWHGR